MKRKKSMPGNLRGTQQPFQKEVEKVDAHKRFGSVEEKRFLKWLDDVLWSLETATNDGRPLPKGLKRFSYNESSICDAADRNLWCSSDSPIQGIVSMADVLHCSEVAGAKAYEVQKKVGSSHFVEYTKEHRLRWTH